MKCWQTLKQMILDSGATSLLEFKMSFPENVISVLVSSYGKGVFDLVTVSFFEIIHVLHTTILYEIFEIILYFFKLQLVMESLEFDTLRISNQLNLCEKIFERFRDNFKILMDTGIIR